MCLLLLNLYKFGLRRCYDKYFDWCLPHNVIRLAKVCLISFEEGQNADSIKVYPSKPKLVSYFRGNKKFR